MFLPLKIFDFYFCVDLRQPFYPIFPHFFPIFPSQDHFSKSLKHLKKQKNNIFKRYIIQNPHIIYLTYISKSFQLKSISFKV